MFTTLLTATLVVAAPPDPLDQLQGEWKVSKLEREGADQPEPPSQRILVRGDKILLVRDNQEPLDSNIRIKIDAAPSPKLIDLKVTNGKTLEGIFKVEGKRWTMCLQVEAAVPERPTKFETKGDTRLLLVVLEKPD